MSFQSDVRARLEEIARAQAVHSEKLEQNTRVLVEHHVRTSAIEARLKPVETHIALVAAITKVIISVVTIGAGVGAIIHYFFTKP